MISLKKAKVLHVQFYNDRKGTVMPLCAATGRLPLDSWDTMSRVATQCREHSRKHGYSSFQLVSTDAAGVERAASPVQTVLVLNPDA